MSESHKLCPLMLPCPEVGFASGIRCMLPCRGCESDQRLYIVSVRSARCQGTGTAWTLRATELCIDSIADCIAVFSSCR